MWELIPDVYEANILKEFLSTLSNMRTPIETIIELTAPSFPTSQRRAALKEFAQIGGWRPSDEIEEYPGTEKLANGHLLIEHGLENSAVITFLKDTNPFEILSIEDKLQLISISYNNLVDWHLFPHRNGVTRVYNLKDPLDVEDISKRDISNAWNVEAFERITSRRINPNLKSLDLALIETVSLWKRSLAAEIGSRLEIETISRLFNAIFFVRAFEDNRRYRIPNENRLLVEKWLQLNATERTIRYCLESSLAKLGANNVPKDTHKF